MGGTKPVKSFVDCCDCDIMICPYCGSSFTSFFGIPVQISQAVPNNEMWIYNGKTVKKIKIK